MTSLSVTQRNLITSYSLDANVFIVAWRDRYPIDLYPGFWECIKRFADEKRLLTVDRVLDEITSPKELVDWLKLHWHDSINSTREAQVASVFSQMQTWVQNNQQFSPAAKHEFAGAADGWLAAYARVHDSVLITEEVFEGNVRRRVPLPNLCKRFGVDYCNTIGMLRGLGVAFDLRTPR